MRIVFAVLTPLLIAPLMVSMVMAVRSFQQNYSEALCRMESVRVQAIENIENDEPIVANFGGDECLTPMMPTVEFMSEAGGGDAGPDRHSPTPTVGRRFISSVAAWQVIERRPSIH